MEKITKLIIKNLIFMFLFWFIIYLGTQTSTYYNQGVYHGIAFVVLGEWIFNLLKTGWLIKNE